MPAWKFSWIRIGLLSYNSMTVAADVQVSLYPALTSVAQTINPGRDVRRLPLRRRIAGRPVADTRAMTRAGVLVATLRTSR